jgi:RHS repeat-associated protein
MDATANDSISQGRLYGYGISGNLLQMGESSDDVSNPSSDEPIVDHLWLGSHLISSITNKGDVPGEGLPECFIATVAFGTPLAEELLVFQAFRDRALAPFGWGREFIDWYYDEGPRAAQWINAHSRTRWLVRLGLTAVAVPLKAAMFGHWAVLIFIFLCALCAFAVSKKYGWSWTTALAASASVALSLVIVYSIFIDARRAMAAVTELDVYYYTSDHIGRPFNLRDGATLTWFEHHYPFGEVISEEVAGGPVLGGSTMYAGGGDYAISWKPNFRFPGQYEDSDMGTAANSRPLFVQNHYREYMPRFGRYNRVDPICFDESSPYIYVSSSPFNFSDRLGLFFLPMKRCHVMLISKKIKWRNVKYDSGAYDPSLDISTDEYDYVVAVEVICCPRTCFTRSPDLDKKYDKTSHGFNLVFQLQLVYMATCKTLGYKFNAWNPSCQDCKFSGRTDIIHNAGGILYARFDF